MVKAMAKVCSCSSAANLESMAGGQDTLERMQSAVTLLLRGLGEDPTREGLRETPRVGQLFNI
jgi:GTP cyclohydrolase I